MPATQSLAQLRSILEGSGFHAALEFLNARVPHRYTVVYRFDGKAFFGMDAVDKLKQPIPKLFNCVPFEESFCQYTVDEGVFRTEASMLDSRLDGHMHQANVQSYTGLPLTDASGELYGTFCHLDLEPRQLGDDEYEFLQKAVGLLGVYVPAASELTGN